MTDSPAGILLSCGVGLLLGYWWWQDFSFARKGNPTHRPLPGATSAPSSWILLGVIGAVLLTGLETVGEIVLDISGEQKNVTVLFLGAMLAAALVEEVVFRGYLVVANKGRAWLLGSIFGASLLFALGHDFLWQHTSPEDAAWWEFWRGFSLNFSLKGWFSFGTVFFVSLYFYLLRFHSKNPSRSLLPCFAAHAARNLAVFAIKLAQGHVIGWY